MMPMEQVGAERVELRAEIWVAEIWVVGVWVDWVSRSAWRMRRLQEKARYIVRG